jgi:hypothetical protein
MIGGNRVNVPRVPRPVSSSATDEALRPAWMDGGVEGWW